MFSAFDIEKGGPTGEMVVTAQGASYTNLSSPVMAEAYIDFGLIGVILFGVAVSICIRLIDDTYWSLSLNEEKEDYLIRAVYPVLVAFLIYVFRGALLHTLMRLYGVLLFPLAIYVLNRCLCRQACLSRRNSKADKNM